MSETTPIPLLVPKLPDYAALKPYIEQIDASRHYSNFGPLIQSLEKRLAELFQRQTAHPMHVTTVSSATTGLELVLSSLGLPKGSRVLVPALTFVATLTAVIRANLVPVITDIDPDSWLLTPEIAQEAIMQSGAAAALVVATFGQAQDTAAWSAFQKETGVRIVIDAASAFGTQWLDAVDIPVVYSMHATKSLAAGEGGLVVSGTPRLNRLIKELSNFGINLNPDAGLPVGHLSYVGSNAKLSEYHAAVAHASLDVWDDVARMRADIHRDYCEQLETSCGNELRWQTGMPISAPTVLNVRVGSSDVRTYLEKLCAQRQIATRRWYQPLLHQHAANVAPIVAMPCPVAEDVASDLIGLPFSVFLTTTDIERVVDTVKHAIGINSTPARNNLTRNHYG